jgi:hypothetical protein
MMEVWARMNLLVNLVCRLKGLRTGRRGIRELGIKCSNYFLQL